MRVVMQNRWFPLFLVVAALWLAIVNQAQAQVAPYPSKTVKFVLPFGAGTGTDIMARRVANDLQTRMNGTFVVENAPGASGMIAASAVAKAKPDGYTLLLTTNTTHAANSALFKQLPYDPVKDFEPITLIGETPFLLVVRKDHPAKNVKELVAWLKSNPEKSAYGYGNSTGQVAGAAFSKGLGVAAIAVPFKSTPASATELIGGRIAFMFIDTPAAQTFIGQGGKLRAIAITSAERSHIVPDLPTLFEATGVPGLDIVSFSAAFAPAGTPRDIVMALNKAIREATSTPEYLEWRKSMSSDSKTSTPEGLHKYVVEAIGSWGAKVRAAGIEAQ